MRRSSASRPKEETSIARETSHETTAPTGTQPAPQITVTPSRNAQKPVRGDDLLRTATTANASSYGRDAQAPHAILPSRRTRSTDVSHRQQQLEDENISAHDKARGSPPSPSGTIAVDPDNDFATDRMQDLVVGRGLEYAVRSGVAANSALRTRRDTAESGGDGQNLGHGSHGSDSDTYHSHSDRSDWKVAQQQQEPLFFNSWGPIRHRLRKPFAEFLGTMVFMTIGLCGSITHMSSARNDNASLLMAYLAWGFGVMTAIYIAGGISGAHMNPTISLVLAVFRGFPWHDFWQYLVAQLLGSIAASGIAYGLYRDAISDFAGSNMSIAGPAFWTAPRPGLSSAAAFFNEFVATAILAGSVLAMGDDGNAPPGAGMAAFVLGLLTIALEMAFSYNTGTCLNPGRDLGPRLVTWWAGFGSVPFTLSHHWFIWGPWVSTVLGGLFGALIYDSMIFIGGESPVNYPSEALRDRFRPTADLSWPKLRGKSRTGRGNDKQGDAISDKDVGV
ncbi:aquaporin [Cladophialophora carrionii]|uniref:Aquaporin n=1 Tax=Cladophialophora carrionii TaxID=86049 RepID=A0A1C1CB80_9EURO|nr:aquaporin [Cladophialophora carrionii]